MAGEGFDMVWFAQIIRGPSFQHLTHTSVVTFSVLLAPSCLTYRYQGTRTPLLPLHDLSAGRAPPRCRRIVSSSGVVVLLPGEGKGGGGARPAGNTYGVCHLLSEERDLQNKPPPPDERGALRLRESRGPTPSLEILEEWKGPTFLKEFLGS